MKLGRDSSNFDKFFIGGEWVNPSTKRRMAVVSPATESVVLEVAEGANADIDMAVIAARNAFDHGPWPSLNPIARAPYVTELARLLRERSDELIDAWVAQIGAPAEFAKMAIPMAISALDRAVEQASTFKFVQRHEPSIAGAGYLAYEPVGVVAAIVPWNAPLAAMLNKIGSALVAGCSLIMKPAPQTPIEAYVIAECAAEAGFPDGVVNLVTADRDVSEYLVQQKGVDKVAFTGSVAAGRRIASACGERIGRVTLELGGKSAAIVLDDYDLEAAATVLGSAVCRLSGQNCAALTRVIVSEGRHDELVAYLAKYLGSMKVGSPHDAEANVGPVAMKRQLEQIEGYVAAGVKEGAELVLGGKRATSMHRGYYFEPTLFANVRSDMTIAQEEIFGPVLSVLPCKDEDDAVRIANDSNYGLAGAVFTTDVDKAYAISRKVRTGTMAQNAPLVDFGIAFGGFKESGFGREGGVFGLTSYLEAKTVLLSEVPESV